MQIIVPTKDFLLLEPLAPKGKIGSIIIPEAHQNRIAPQGKILDHGPDANMEGMNIDSLVFFAQHTEYRATLEGREYILVSESNVIGVILEETPNT